MLKRKISSDFLLYLIFFALQIPHWSFASEEPEEWLRERNTTPEG